MLTVDALDARIQGAHNRLNQTKCSASGLTTCATCFAMVTSQVLDAALRIYPLAAHAKGLIWRQTTVCFT